MAKDWSKGEKGTDTCHDPYDEKGTKNPYNETSKTLNRHGPNEVSPSKPGPIDRGADKSQKQAN